MKNPKKKARSLIALVDTILTFLAFLAVVFFMVGGGMEKTVEAIQGYKYESK